MIQVISGCERQHNAAVFDELFARRTEVFAQGRGWSLPLKYGRDIDTYDHDDAAYVVASDDDGVVIGGVRVNRTDQGCLSADLFPHLYADGQPTVGAHIFEGTRYFVAPKERNAKLVRALRCEVVAVAFEHVQRQGGTLFQTVVDTPMLSAFMEMSREVTVLGGSHPYGGGKGAQGGGECVLMQVPVTTAVIAEVRAAASLSHAEARSRRQARVH